MSATKAVRPPGYLLHKSTGQARVRIRGRDHYLGRHNSPESWKRYRQLIAQYFAADDTPTQIVTVNGTSVASLAAQYVEFAEEHFRHNPDERYRIKAAISPLIQYYGSIPAEEFTPKKLKDIRQRIIDRRNVRTGKRLSRKYVNQLIGVVKKIFKWGVSEELVPVSTFQALDTVQGLRKGRTQGLSESKRIRPVPDRHVAAVLPFLQPEVATMVQIQLLTGMRPDEVTPMKSQAIDRATDVWLYTIQSRFEDDDSNGRKTDWLENVEQKEIFLGPKSQDLLLPWIAKSEPDEFLFSPRRVCERLGKINRSRPPRDRYDDETYCQAVQRACRRASVPVWTPGRLRHNAATLIRQRYGAEAARLVLGHRHLSTTEIYAERDTERYRAIAAAVG